MLRREGGELRLRVGDALFEPDAPVEPAGSPSRVVLADLLEGSQTLLLVETPQERRERLERGPAASCAPKRKRRDGDERSLNQPDDAECARERDVRVQRERAPRHEEREPQEHVTELLVAFRFATWGSTRGKASEA